MDTDNGGLQVSWEAIGAKRSNGCLGEVKGKGKTFRKNILVGSGANQAQ